MSASLPCPQCGSSLNAQDKLVGENLVCPLCGMSVAVPDASPLEELAPLPSEIASEPSLENLDWVELQALVPPPLMPAPAAPPPPARKPEAPVKSYRTLGMAAACGAGVLVCGILVAWVAGYFSSSPLDPVAAAPPVASAPAGASGASSAPAGDAPPAATPALAEPLVEKVAMGAAAPSPPAPATPAPATPAPATPAPATDTAAPAAAPSGTGSAPPAAVPRTFEQTLDRLKAATVFVKVTSSAGLQSGSGFLLEASGEQGVIVTNAHVITPEQGSLREVSCVFHSGTRDEFEVKANVGGKDDDADLAFLTVKHPKLPEVIDSATDVTLRETSTVMILGFPFGEILATRSRGPAITVSKGSVSSLRRDDYDNLVLLQIDGGIHPGNSGGPLVSEEGILVGIAVAKVRGADLGFAIPKQRLAEALRGRLASVAIRQVSRTSSERSLEFRAEFIDPKQNIASAELLGFDAAKQSVKEPEANGQWRQAASELRFTQPFQMSGHTGSLRLTTAADLKGVMFQIRWKRKDGSEGITEPTKLELDGSKTIAADSPDAPARPVPGEKPGPAAPPAFAHGRIVMLEGIMSDFALNPATGDVAALDPRANCVYLLREAILAAGDAADAYPEVKVGETPVAVTYKRFGELEFFAVVCSQDSHMYLLDAREFTLKQKIPLQSAGASNVTASLNPLDPFVYYNYGSGHDSAAGAVDLRKMVDRGLAIDDAMDCAVSADGRVAYRRGPWSPSGFESLLMTTDFSAETPRFVRLFYDHRSTGPYVPDPFGEFTASHPAVYTKSLETPVGSLQFMPSCFFTDRPVLMGLAGMTLHAASWNTWAGIGTPLQLPAELGGDPLSLPRGADSQGDFKRVALRVRLLADDKHERVIYAFRDKVALIPLADFGLPEEPFLRLEVSTTELVAGRNHTIQIAGRDPRITLDYGDLPAGAAKTNDGLQWLPQEEDIGTVTVPVTLSFEDTQRVVQLEFRVGRPHLTAPVEISGFSVDDSASQAVCWSNPAPQGRPRPGEPPAAPESQLVLVPFRSGGQTNSKSVPFAIRQVTVFDSHVALLSATDNTRVEVYSLPALERVKTLLGATPLTRISLDKDQLLLHGATSADVYDTKTFRRLRTIEGADSGARGNSSPVRTEWKDGVIAEGILRDAASNRARLLLAPANTASFPGADPRLMQGAFLRRIQEPTMANRSAPSGGTSIVAGPVPLPGSKTQVSLELMTIQVQPAGSVHTLRLKRRASLLFHDAGGVLVNRVLIASETIPLALGAPNTPPAAAMQVVGDKVFVAVGREIFRWTAPPNSQEPSSQADENTEFHVVPEQSTFVVAAPKTELQHTVNGGQGPFEFFLLTRLDGVTLDETSGVVTIDSDALLPQAVPLLSREARGATDIPGAMQKLEAGAERSAGYLIKVLGRKPTGFPLGVPIHVKVIDSQGAVAEIQYFVVLELPFRQAAGLVELAAPNPAATRDT